MIKVSTDLVSSKDPVSGSRWHLSSVSSHDGRGEGTILGLFYKSTKTVHGMTLFSGPNHLSHPLTLGG
jgi:hypothetical protein